MIVSEKTQCLREWVVDSLCLVGSTAQDLECCRELMRACTMLQAEALVRGVVGH